MLPKPYISYSAWSLWKSNKDAFRKRYYENEKPFDTTETLFGKDIAKALEENSEVLKHVPRYAEPEFSIEVMIGDVKVLGYLDSYDPDKHRFLEYKTGHADKNGKAPWDKIKVLKHNQLPFYSMLIKELTGKVLAYCTLIWLETEFVHDTREWNGIVLEELGRSKTLRLTGRMKKFRRYIYKSEREKIKRELLKAVDEIKKDFYEYKRLKSGDVAVRQAIPQEKPAR